MPEFPLDWEELRDERADRDGYACQECGETEGPLYVMSTTGSFVMSALETRCDEHCDGEWLVSRARVVDGDDGSVGEDDVGEMRRVEEVGGDGVAGTVLGWLRAGGDLRETRYPDSGGYRGFVYPWELVQFLLGVLAVVGVPLGVIAAVLDVAGVVDVGGLLAAVGAGGLSPGLFAWGVFGVVYLGYLLRRDYGDAHWPRVRWVPMDEAVLRRYVEGVALLVVGAGLFAASLAGVDGLPLRVVGELSFAAGLVVTVVRMNYVVVRGLLFDEYRGNAFAWEWSMRMAALLVLVEASVGTSLPAAVVVAVPVVLAVAFAGRMHVAGVRWADPRERGDVGAVAALRLSVGRWRSRVEEAMAPVAGFVDRLRTGKRAGIDEED